MTPAPAQRVPTARSRSLEQDFLTAVSLGDIPDHSVARLIARSDNIGNSEVDLWFGDGTRIYPTAAAPHSIASSSPQDSPGGDGARTLIAIGLDSALNPISEVVPLSGTSPVQTANSYLRLTSLTVQQHGTLQAAAGAIRAIHPSSGPQSTIPAGLAFSYGTHFTVPAGRVAAPLSITVDGGSDKDAVAMRIVPRLPGIAPQEGRHFVLRGHPFHEPFRVPPSILPPGSDVKWVARNLGSGTARAFASMEFLVRKIP